MYPATAASAPVPPSLETTSRSIAIICAETVLERMRGAPAARAVADPLDEVRLASAAVGDRGVRGGHLDRRDADALADRHVADREPDQ